MAQYRKSARRRGFAAESVSSAALNQIDRQTDRMVSGLREQRDAILSDRSAYLTVMEENARIEKEQAQTNQYISEQNAQTRQKELLNQREQALNQYKLKSETTQAFFNSIAKFSEAAGVRALEIEKEREEKENDELAKRIAVEGDNNAHVKKWKALQLEAEEQHIVASGELAKAAKQGVDQNEISKLGAWFMSLNPKVQNALMQYQARGLPSFINSQADREFVDSKGQTYKVSERFTSQERINQVHDELTLEYLGKIGISGKGAEFRWASGFAPSIQQIRESELRTAKARETDQYQAEYEAKMTTAVSSLKGTELTNFIKQNGRGARAVLGNDRFDKLLNTFARSVDPKTGELRFDVESIIAGVEGPDGAPMSPIKADNLRRLAREARAGVLDEIDREVKDNIQIWGQDRYEEFERILSEQKGDSFQDEADITRIIEAFEKENPQAVARGFTIYDTSIGQLIKATQNENKEVELERAQQAIVNQNVTPELIRNTTDPQVKQSLTKAMEEQNKRKYGTNYGDVNKTYGTMAKQHIKPAATSLDEKTIMAQFLETELKKEHQRRFAARSGRYEGDDAALSALNTEIAIELRNELAQARTEQGKKDSKWRLGTGPNNTVTFPGLEGIQKQAYTSFTKDRYKVNDVITTFANRGEDIKTLASNPDQFIVPAELQRHHAAYMRGDGSFNVPLEASLLATRLNQYTGTQNYSGMSIMNSWWKSQGLATNVPDPVIVSPELEEIITNKRNVSEARLARYRATQNGTVHTHTNPRFSNNTFGNNGKQRTINIGRMLVNDLGYKAWQHPNFNLDKGYVAEGGQHRYWRDPQGGSAHLHDEALDFPVSHNTVEQLDQLYDYLTKNKEFFGIKKILWRGAPGHGPDLAPDNAHLHVQFYQ